MKKYVALLLALAMVFTLSGCGNNKKEAELRDNDEPKEILEKKNEESEEDNGFQDVLKDYSYLPVSAIVRNETTNKDLRVISFSYNEKGQLICESQSEFSDDYSINNSSTVYYYTDGVCIKEVEAYHTGLGADMQNRVSIRKYSMDRKQATVIEKNNKGNETEWKYEYYYDEYGNVQSFTRTTETATNTVEYINQYDNGRLISVDESELSGIKRIYYYEYDEEGRLCSTELQLGDYVFKTTYVYGYIYTPEK